MYNAGRSGDVDYASGFEPLNNQNCVGTVGRLLGSATWFQIFAAKAFQTGRYGGYRVTEFWRFHGISSGGRQRRAGEAHSALLGMTAWASPTYQNNLSIRYGTGVTARVSWHFLVELGGTTAIFGESCRRFTRSGRHHDHPSEE